MEMEKLKGIFDELGIPYQEFVSCWPINWDPEVRNNVPALFVDVACPGGLSFAFTKEGTYKGMIEQHGEFIKRTK
jgi:hypothetical protein